MVYFFAGSQCRYSLLCYQIFEKKIHRDEKVYKGLWVLSSFEFLTDDSWRESQPGKMTTVSDDILDFHHPVIDPKKILQHIKFR